MERFKEVHDLADLGKPSGIVQAVTADFNRDGWPDLFLATGSLERTRHEPSRILLNERGGAFLDAAFVPGFQPANSPGVAVATSAGSSVWYSYLAGEGVVSVKAQH